MFTKRKKEAEAPKEDAFDVSSMLGTYEEKPIMIADDTTDEGKKELSKDVL